MKLHFRADISIPTIGWPMGYFLYLLLKAVGHMVTQMVALLFCRKKVLGLNSGLGGHSTWSLHVLHMHVWVLSGYFDFPSLAKKMSVRLIG